MDPGGSGADRDGRCGHALHRVDRRGLAGAQRDALLGPGLLHGAEAGRRGADARLGHLGPPRHVLVLLGAVGGGAARDRRGPRGPLGAPGGRRDRGVGHPAAVDGGAGPPLPVGPRGLVAAVAVGGQRTRAPLRRGERLRRSRLAARPDDAGAARGRPPRLHVASRRLLQRRCALAGQRSHRGRQPTLRRGGGPLRARRRHGLARRHADLLHRGVVDRRGPRGGARPTGAPRLHRPPRRLGRRAALVRRSVGPHRAAVVLRPASA